MLKLIKILFGVISISMLVILFHREDINQQYKMLNAERDDFAYKINFSSKGLKNKERYDLLTEKVQKYKGNMFFDYYDTEQGIRIKYVYLSDLDYYEHFDLEWGRFFEMTEFGEDVFLSTLNTQERNQIGKVEDFGGNNNIEIRPLYSLVRENRLISGDITLRFKSEEIFEKFISDLKEESAISITVRNIDLDKEMTYPFEIFIFIAYLMILLLYYFYIINRRKEYSIKRLFGYSFYSIYLENILYMIKCLTVILFICYASVILVLFESINSFFYEFVIKIIIIYFITMIMLIIVSFAAHRVLIRWSISTLMSGGGDLKITLVASRITKVITTIVIIISAIGAYNAAKVNDGMKLSMNRWEQTKNYAVLPTISGMSHDYLISEDFREKQKKLFLTFNSFGGIYADFYEYTPESLQNLSIFGDRFDNITRHASVNPNYLEINQVVDVKGENVLIDEQERDYVLLVPEKYQEIKDELLEYYYDIKGSRSNKSILRNQNIEIVWIENGQSVFSYNLDVYPEQGGMVYEPIIRVVTENNGDIFDYDRIMGYEGNPYKIKVEGANSYEFIYEALNEHNLGQYVPYYYKAYDYIAPDIERIKYRIYYRMLVIIGLLVLEGVLVYQSTKIFFHRNKRYIIVKKLHGYKFIDKYYSLLNLFILEWAIIISTLGVFRISNNKLAIIAVAIVALVELLMYLVIIICFEKKVLISFLKGRE